MNELEIIEWLGLQPWSQYEPMALHPAGLVYEHPRQLGLTTELEVRLLLDCLRDPEQEQLLVGHSRDFAKKILGGIRHKYYQLRDYPGVDTSTELKIEPLGMRVVIRPTSVHPYPPTRENPLVGFLEQFTRDFYTGRPYVYFETPAMCKAHAVVWPVDEQDRVRAWPNPDAQVWFDHEVIARLAQEVLPAGLGITFDPTFLVDE